MVSCKQSKLPQATLKELSGHALTLFSIISNLPHFDESIDFCELIALRYLSPAQ